MIDHGCRRAGRVGDGFQPPHAHNRGPGAGEPRAKRRAKLLPAFVLRDGAYDNEH